MPSKTRKELFQELDTHLCAAYNLADSIAARIGDAQERYTFTQLVRRKVELTMHHAIKIQQRIEPTEEEGQQ